MRQHHSDGLTVDDPVVGSERVRRGVRGAQHAHFDRHPGVGGAQLHSRSRFQIVRLFQHPGQMRDRQAECFARVEQRQFVAPARDSRFQRVGDGIQAGAGGDRPRLR